MTPTHDAYLDNGTYIGLTVGKSTVAYAGRLVNMRKNFGIYFGNCDTMLFLGGKESSTLKEISEMLGKETIDLYKQGNADI